MLGFIEIIIFYKGKREMIETRLQELCFLHKALTQCCFWSTVCDGGPHSVLVGEKYVLTPSERGRSLYVRI